MRRIESAALAWPLGAGAVSVGMLWLNALGLSLNAQIAVMTAGVAVGAVAVGVRMWGTNIPSASPADFRGVRLLLTILIAIQIAYVALLAVGRPLIIWDSWVTWAMKARIIFLDGHISGSVFADPSRMVTHLDYPLLVPLVEAWTFAWAGTADDRLAGIQAVLFFASLLGVCYSVLRRLGVGNTWALAGVAVIASMTQISGLAALVFADLPLAVYATIAGSYLAIWFETKSPGALLIAALAGGFMPWTKREGILLLVAFCLVVLLVNRDHRRAWLAAGALACGGLLLSGPWWAFVKWQGIVNAAFLPITLATIQANLSRLPVIAGLELIRLLSPDWSYVWLLAALVVRSLLIGQVARRTLDLLPMIALLYLGLGSLAYVFSDFVPYQQHVISSIDRLMAHVLLLPGLWITCRSLEGR